MTPRPHVLLKKTRLRITQAAVLLAVHKSTVRRWIEDGKLEAVRTGGGHWRIRVESIRKYL